MTAPIVEVRDLAKTFHLGFFRKRVEAVKRVGFDVHEGEVFGLLGPNGAGKTTTMKMMLALIFPTRGNVRIFGKPPTDREARKRLGYLPENPYVYQYLRPFEFLDLCGRLVGLDRHARRARAEAMIEKVGLAHAVDRPIGKFSKGMMQRIGLAQALLHDPELLFLDEPMSGLDPIGRAEVRDLLLEERRRGRTIVFTSHILTDVERLCDRVVILRRGEVAAEGTLDQLLHADVRRVEIVLDAADDALRARLGELGGKISERDRHVVVALEGDALVDPVLRAALDAGRHVLAVTPERETLEALFLRDAVAPAAEGGKLSSEEPKGAEA